MVHHLPITKARVNLGQVVRRVVRNRVVRNKEYFILEKDGIPVAGIMGADELEDYLELQDPKVNRAIAKSSAQHRAGKSRPIEEFLAEFNPKPKGAKAAKRSRV